LIAAAIAVAPGAVAAEDLGARARAMLATHCGDCHGGGDADRGGFDHVLDPGKLVASGLVVRFKAADSPLYERIAAGEMPPRSIKRRPSAAERAVVRRWIEAGAPAPDADAKRARRSRLGLAGIDRLIAADLAAAPAADRAHLRYLSFAHLADAGAPAASLDLARAGVAKVLASLSWKRRLPRPAAIGPGGALVRIDLREIGWSRALWDEIGAADPYALRRRSAEARRAARLARTATPAIRADWFAAATTRPPLYHRILAIPKTAGALERRLGVDRTRPVIRAGFNRSGISKHNRIIERRRLAGDGYLWRSYDFRGSSGRRSIFDHPLGPGGSDGFVADGGELIFSLPNGMQGYLLVDARGRRIDKAPTDVVFDPSRPDGAVENGVSCMGCHGLGIIDKRDEVRPHLLANRAAFDARDPTTAPTALAVYPEAAILDAAFAVDRGRFVAALDALGANAAREPISALADEFDRELDLDRAAAELGLTAAALRERIESDDLLGRNLGALLVRGGSLKRDVFAALFPTVAPRLGAGDPIAAIDPGELLVRRCEDGDGRDCVEVGRELLRQRRRAAAIRAFSRACDRDAAIGCTAGGELAGDPRLLDRGCRGGDPRGCELFAARRPDRAIELLTRACDEGRATGCAALGDVLARAKRHGDALSRWGQACDRGLALGCSRAADLLEKGRGRVRENEPRAAALYRRACDAGDRRGCLEAAELYYEGDDMPEKRALAAQLYDKACRADSAEGCYQLAKQLRSGKGVRRDKPRAKALFARACRLGKRRACLR
jgi:TPR repeat protein/mono/diheme cytochrome c family protein